MDRTASSMESIVRMHIDLQRRSDADEIGPHYIWSEDYCTSDNESMVQIHRARNTPLFDLESLSDRFQYTIVGFKDSGMCDYLEGREKPYIEHSRSHAFVMRMPDGVLCRN